MLAAFLVDFIKSALEALETRLQELSKKYLWAFIAFGNQKIWLFLLDGSIALDWLEHSSSLLFALDMLCPSSLVNLTNINLHDLGSIESRLEGGE